MIYAPVLNYADGDLEPARQMMNHKDTVPGLSDGGAHVGTICDGSFPTTLLTYWTRDRTRFENFVSEAALAHAAGDKIEAAQQPAIGDSERNPAQGSPGGEQRPQRGQEGLTHLSCSGAKRNAADASRIDGE